MSNFIKQKMIPEENIVLGLIELSSIAVGIQTLNAMVKWSPISILDSRTISPGNYLIIFTGELAEVEEALKRGLETCGKWIIDHLCIANLHSQIIPAMLNLNESTPLVSMGIIESKTVASAIIAADSACKASEVKLIELRLSNGLGGKSFFIITGELYDIESSMEKAIDAFYQKESLYHHEIITSAHEDLKDFF